MAVYGDDEQGNGAFNQNVLNVTAVGTASADGDGNLSIDSLGSFPVAVNRTDQATTNFRLRLQAPAQTPAGDTKPPEIIAQYPSACAYTFGTDGFQQINAVEGDTSSTSISDSEADCIGIMDAREIISAGDTADPDATYNFPEPFANSFPIDASPSIVFSEPVDPSSAESNIRLSANGTEVDTHLRVEGSSVVVDPIGRLAADTQYTLTVASGITDLAGNGLAGDYLADAPVSEITFNTEPMVIPTDASGTPIDLSQDLTQRSAVRQVAPYLTVLTPGLPCALLPASELSADGSADAAADYFRSGGNTAGRCQGMTETAPGDYAPVSEGSSPNAPLDASDIDVEADRPVGYEPPPGVEVGDYVLVNVTDDDLPMNFPPPVSTKIDYPVFNLPANQTVDAYFSKPVKAGTIQLADGCLLGGSGNTNPDATVAVQTIDEDGNCTGVVDGAIAMLAPDSAYTRGFSFRAAHGFEPGQRYWIVVCGSPDPVQGAGASQCATGKTIRGQNGLTLNTNPLLGSGTAIIQRSSFFGGCGPNGSDCFDDNRAQGGPDIVMPFDAAPVSQDFRGVGRALPETDTNGNGFLDNTFSENPSTIYPSNTLEPHGFPGVISGFNTGEDKAREGDFNATLGRERHQPANAAWLFSTVMALNNYSASVGYLSGGLPFVVNEARSGSACEAASAVTFDDGTPVVGDTHPQQCVPVQLLPGGLISITSTPAGQPSGRVFVRIPYALDSDGEPAGPQSGYIIPRCQGTDSRGRTYDYQPCFVATLRTTVSHGRDGYYAAFFGGISDVDVPPQDIDVQAYGPVAFGRNGRLVISTRNANTFYAYADVDAAGGSLMIPVNPDGQYLQLVGPPIHGGLSFQ